MAEITNKHASSWTEEAILPSYSSLSGNLETGTLVVGGGLTGILTAYLLNKSGEEVVLVEAAQIGSAATGLTTAFITQSLDTSYADLVSILGHKRAGQVAASHGTALNLYDEIISSEKIACDFKRVDNYLLARQMSNLPAFRQELSVLKSFGYQVENVDPQFFQAEAVAKWPNQAKIQPLQFLSQLSRIAVSRGVRIFENLRVSSYERDSDIWQVKVGANLVKARNLVVATHQPLNQPWHLFFRKGEYVTYIQEYFSSDVSLPEAIYEDMSDPYHYFRIDYPAGKDEPARILFGGEDHRKDIPIRAEKNIRALRQEAKQFFRGAHLKLGRHWSGPIIEPLDGLAYIGRDQRSGAYFAFGYSGNGLSYAGLAAMIFKEQICGPVGSSSISEIYAVNRLPSLRALLAKGRDYTKILYGGAIKNSGNRN